MSSHEFYDMHTHILPNIDDGSDSMKESLTLLKCLYSQNVTHICLTPHYYSDSQKLNAFLNNRDASFKKLIQNKLGTLKFLLGAEVFVTDYLFNNANVKDLCLGNTHYMLVEFPYSSHFSRNGKSMGMLRKLINMGMTPILAHVERYKYLFTDDFVTLTNLLQMGILLQVNVSSFTNFRTYNKLKILFECNLVHFLGSDSHFSRIKHIDDFEAAIGKLTSDFPEALEQIQSSGAIFFQS